MKSANRLGIATALLMSGALAASGLALASGVASASPSAAHAAFGFSTLDNAADPTFNQLLGINDHGLIAGYFGSGAQDHPNKGYLLGAGSYTNENFPGSVQTQVTGLNNRGVTVGFWSTMNNTNMVNDNFGFYESNGQFHNVNFPAGDNASPPVNQLLGVNDANVAVGFYTDAAGNSHGYQYQIGSGKFSLVNVPGATSSTAAAINGRGDVAGFYTNAAGTVQGFLRTVFGQVTNLAFPGASATSALGVTGSDEVVGFYTTGSGDAAASHGFTWTRQGGFATVDDPNGVGTTTINGVNDAGDLVGFYVDANGNTDGFLGTPARTRTFTVRLAPMPQGTITVVRDEGGNVAAKVRASGLTPGSAHGIALVDRDGAVLAALQPVTADGTGQVNDKLVSSGFSGQTPDGSRLVITQDTTSGSPVIGRTAPLRADQATYRLH